MLELWQTEWCPASRRVRKRLTELGLDYVERMLAIVGNAELAPLATTIRTKLEQVVARSTA